jgi:hypothetical protein
LEDGSPKPNPLEPRTYVAESDFTAIVNHSDSPNHGVNLGNKHESSGRVEPALKVLRRLVPQPLLESCWIILVINDAKASNRRAQHFDRLRGVLRSCRTDQW